MQARAQLLALLAVLPNIEEIKVCDILPKAAESFIAEAEKKAPKSKIIVVENEAKAFKKADIVITTTPSKKPLIFESMIFGGVHFNCIGADAPLKEELDPAILKKAKIVVDDWKQASHSGEINVPLSKGILSRNDVYAELGDILIGKKLGRTSNEEITVFDSTGLAIQDAATVELVYKKAKSKKIGHIIEI